MARDIPATVRTDESLSDFFKHMGKDSYQPPGKMMFIALLEWAEAHGYSDWKEDRESSLRKKINK